jgi:rhomboid protease GluP
LLSLGQEVEALYGTRRFLVVYFLAGLLGNVASYLVPTFLIPPASQLAGAPQWLITPSLGASGAIFGIVGADVAFYLANRRSMGNPGQRQLLNLVILIGINLVIGFTPGSNINNYAHLGGLIGGLALGAGLSPRYAAGWDPIAGQPRLVNHRTLSREAFVVAGVCLVLLLGWYLGTQRWEPYLAFLM